MGLHIFELLTSVPMNANDLRRVASFFGNIINDKKDTKISEFTKLIKQAQVQPELINFGVRLLIHSLAHLVHEEAVSALQTSPRNLVYSYSEKQEVDGKYRIPEDVMQELSSKNLAEVFLNAMMTELRTERGAIHLLTNVIDVGESSFDLTETVIGLVVARLYNETDRPAVVCDVEELRQQTTSLLGELFRTIRLPITLADSINCFELSLQALYPFVIVDSGEVYYAHPMVVGFLASQGKLDTLRNDNKATMLGLLKLIEKIHDVKAREMEIYLNPVMDTFRGISKRKSMNELFSIQKRIMLYKYLYRGFNASPSVSTN